MVEGRADCSADASAVVTDRGDQAKPIEIANTVSEMRKVEHAGDEGVTAVTGTGF